MCFLSPSGHHLTVHFHTQVLSFVCNTNIGIKTPPSLLSSCPTFLPPSLPLILPPFLSSSLPLFLPPFLLSSLIKGVIVRVPDDKDLKEAQLPDSLRGILSARIDRLTSNQQWVLKVASIVGPRGIAFELLHELLNHR